MNECKLCKLNFKCKYDLNRHLNTKRHKEKLENKNLCDGCFKEFSNKFNKHRHEKSCKVIQHINTQNNIQTNNITNNNINIILPENSEVARTYVMLISDLVRKQTTDCFQRLILNDMSSNNIDLMDYIEKFDTKLTEAYEDMIKEHNECQIQRITFASVENGLEDDLIVICTPISHPNIKFNCKHEKNKLKLNEDKVSKILIETLLDVNDQIVVTHDNDLRGITNLMFKYKDNLHSDEILLEFINKSNKKEICNLSNDFKPASIIKTKYPEYYDKLEDKAIKILNAFNKKSKK